MDLNLKGRNALVCGSSQGIGKAVAIELASLGASVILLARNEETLKRTLKELPQKENKHDYLVADFTDPDQLKKVLENYIQKNKTNFNILINNTGGPPGGLISDAKTVEFEKAFSQHLISNHILVQTVIDGMKKTGYGRIIYYFNFSKATIKWSWGFQYDSRSCCQLVKNHG